jgi:hypothetical protein
MAKLRLSRYSSDVHGICRWACDNAKLDFSKLQPDHVTLNLSDGRQFRASDQPPANAGDLILSLSIKHPDASEPIHVEVGRRQ